MNYLVIKIYLRDRVPQINFYHRNNGHDINNKKPILEIGFVFLNYILLNGKNLVFIFLKKTR